MEFFQKYGYQKDYSASLTRFATILRSLLGLHPTETKELLNPHYMNLRYQLTALT